ncbi:GGDEF domain-containing protein [Marinomonas transparens]|uniref:diguanylate cyclase n=1 Tax=Marinomonas transparens TaxID=2795388 RepID=A0A934JQ45_9GAMM|nr:GGDEF domain-containing protein [Marinomonas transparens]MBJ7536166.1 GGDEF domain-containing protein [Marinomonas transparens]
MTSGNDQNHILIPATYRLLIVTILASCIYTVLFNVYSTPFVVHSFQPLILTTLHLVLLLYLFNNPQKRIHQVINAYGGIMLITSVPNTLYFVIGAWQNQWLFVEMFPPVSGMIILSTTLILLMLPERLNKLVVITWSLNAFPVLLLLFTHPEELQTPRGYDLLFLFGPASLLVVLIIPYQRSIKQYMDEISFDLQHSRAEADRDFLTDVYNRRGLENWLSHLDPTTKLSVLLIDIDHFKSVNDKFGHTTGDHVLVEFASRLRTVYFEEHALARWGGEEFIMVIVNPNQTTAIGETFRNTISQLPYKNVGKITASIGASRIDQAANFTTMVEEADTAVYFAKANGRDQVILYTDTLTENPSQGQSTD